MARGGLAAGSSWRKDRQALMRYRLRAARYGLVIRLIRPYGDVLGILGLIGTLIAFGITIPKDSWRIYGEIFGALIVALAWPLIRYLGSLSAIMQSAASTEEGTRKVFHDMRKGMNNADAYRALCDIYGPLIAEANDSLAGNSATLEFIGSPGLEPAEYACAVLRTHSLASLSTILGNLCEETPAGKRSDQRAESRQKLMNRWRVINDSPIKMGAEEGDNYCLTEMRIEGERLVLDVGVATYGQISRTCEALVNEFALFSVIAGRDGLLNRMHPATMLRCLPWRHHAHSAAGTAEYLFFKPRGRAAGLGVALATVSGVGLGRVHLGERSETVGTYPHVLHLIPAGNCNTYGTHRHLLGTQPATPSWYLQSIIKCEYLEEWLNHEELEGMRILNWRDRVDELWAQQVNEVSPIKLTGIAYDLLNLRPEICAMVRVRFTGSEVLNWEYKRGVPPMELDLADSGSMMPNEIVQSAAGALMLARYQLLTGSGGKRGHEEGDIVS